MTLQKIKQTEFVHVTRVCKSGGVYGHFADLCGECPEITMQNCLGDYADSCGGIYEIFLGEIEGLDAGREGVFEIDFSKRQILSEIA